MNNNSNHKKLPRLFMASVCIATSTAIVLRFSRLCGIFIWTSEWVYVWVFVYCNERIYSVWFWFVCSFSTFTLSHSSTYANAQATIHTRTMMLFSFYSGVEVFSQYSIGSCTYVYFVMTLASYDWIFVLFSSCARYTRRTLTYNQIFIKRMFVSVPFFYFLYFAFFCSHSM